MKIRHIVSLLCLSLFLQSCASTNSGDINKTERGETKVSRRQLPTDKLEQLKSELSSLVGDTITISSVWGDQEAFSFATDLKMFFGAAGLVVDGVTQSMFEKPMVVDGVAQSMFEKPIKGINVIIKNHQAIAKGNTLVHVLQSAGFILRQGGLDNQLKFDVGLVIGTKE